MMKSGVDKNSVQVQIFGVDYSLKSEEEPEYVRMVAKYVDDKVQRIAHNTNVKSHSKIAVLAALNIADEFFQLKQRHENSLNQLNQVESKSKELCDSVDHHLDQIVEITK